MALRYGLLLGLFAAAACGQDPFLQPPTPEPPKADYLNKQAWKKAIQDYFGKSNVRFKSVPGGIFFIDESPPRVCSVRLLEVPLPPNANSWTPQFVPPADGYPTV